MLPPSPLNGLLPLGPLAAYSISCLRVHIRVRFVTPGSPSFGGSYRYGLPLFVQVTLAPGGSGAGSDVPIMGADGMGPCEILAPCPISRTPYAGFVSGPVVRGIEKLNAVGRFTGWRRDRCRPHHVGRTRSGGRRSSISAGSAIRLCGMAVVSSSRGRPVTLRQCLVRASIHSIHQRIRSGVAVEGGGCGVGGLKCGGSGGRLLRISGQGDALCGGLLGRQENLLFCSSIGSAYAEADT